MLGEGDLIYTKTLCRIGHEDYTNKTVLILGGGDGGILHELRKENVGFVTMAEIGILHSTRFLCACSLSVMLCNVITTNLERRICSTSGFMGAVQKIVNDTVKLKGRIC